MPFDKDKKTYTGNCNYDEESRERVRERKRERDDDEIEYHTCCLKFYVAFARLALSLYFLFWKLLCMLRILL